MDAKSVPEYVYEPLCAPDAVRVLALKPALAFDDPLRCDIIQYSRSKFLRNPDNTAHYTAVSYTWGKPVFSKHIICNNEASRLKITPSVDSLLRYLRKQHVSRHLWIDAICLNQADRREKAAQIPLMGEIYEQAKKVRIWLGPGDANTAKVFAFLRAASPIIEGAPDMLDSVLELADDVFGDPSVEKIETFLSQPWFTRRWVLQEVKFAQQATVHCGYDSMPWSWFVCAIGVLRATTEEGSEKFILTDQALEALKVIDRISSVDEMNNSAAYNSAVIWEFHACGCRDPEDRLLSLYGLLDWDNEEVPFEYDMHWTDIYRRSALSFFQNDETRDLGGFRRISLLSHVLAFGSLNGGPSWVPDWSRPRQHTKFHPDPLINPFYQSSREGETMYEGGRTHFEIGFSPELDTQELTLEISSGFCLVQQPIIKLSPGFSWRDAISSLSFLGPLSRSHRSTACVDRLLFLICQMVHLLNPAGVRLDYVTKYYSEAEREKYSGRSHDVTIYLLFHDLRGIVGHFETDNHQWTPREIYVLEAVGQLFESYSLFYLPEPLNLFGFGPQSIQVGDLVAPLQLGLPYAELSDLLEDHIADRRDATALRLIDANDLTTEGNGFRKSWPKARILGQCFCLFSGQEGLHNKSFQIRIV